MNIGATPNAPAQRWTLLCVDDEPNILSALRRTLRAPDWHVLTADGAEAALALLAAGPVDLMLSDMRMPGLDGAQLFERVGAQWPQVIRILLTGHADMNATVAAINRGRIFRYLSKPWDEGELRATVRQGLELLALERDKLRLEALTRQQNLELQQANHQLEERVRQRTAELSDAHERLKRSYLTSIKVFSGLMELRAGRLAGHGRRVADTARQIARAMALGEEAVQQVFVAALLHDIGLIGVPDSLLAKPVARYDGEELALYQRHAEVGEQALMPLDDMQGVAALLRAHHERFDGTGFPARLSGAAIAPGARILAVADAYDELQCGHLSGSCLSAAQARTLMRRGRASRFDPEVLDVFMHITEPQPPRPAAELPIGSEALEDAMVLARDLVSSTGVLMLAAGHVLTAPMIQRIRAFESREGGHLVIYVRPRAD